MGTTERVMGNCEACGKRFSPSRLRQRFCQKPCVRLPRVRTSPRACQKCGKEFLSRANKFCSVECRTANQCESSKKFVITCESCGKSHLTSKATNRFCSSDCYGLATRKVPDCKCKWCGISFRKGHSSRNAGKFCSREHAFRNFRLVGVVERLQAKFTVAIGDLKAGKGKCRRCGCKIHKAALRCRSCRPIYERERAQAANRAERPLVEVACQCGRIFMQTRFGQKACLPCRVERKRDTDAATRKRAKARRKFWIRNTRTEPVSPKAIYQRDGWMCGICGNEILAGVQVPHPLAMTLDHIIPLSKGGSHTADNLQCAHFICNSKKGDTMPEWQDASGSVAM